MATMQIRNCSSGWLVLWLEPLGEDRWLRPDECFQIKTDYEGNDLSFAINHYAADEKQKAAGVESVVVYVENCDWYAEVTDDKGNVVECAHQRPEEIYRKWQGSA